MVMTQKSTWLGNNPNYCTFYTSISKTWLRKVISHAKWYDSSDTVVTKTKKEPKSDTHLSDLDWHDLSPIFLTIMLLHNLKVF